MAAVMHFSTHHTQLYTSRLCLTCSRLNSSSVPRKSPGDALSSTPVKTNCLLDRRQSSNTTQCSSCETSDTGLWTAIFNRQLVTLIKPYRVYIADQKWNTVDDFPDANPIKKGYSVCTHSIPHSFHTTHYKHLAVLAQACTMKLHTGHTVQSLRPG